MKPLTVKGNSLPKTIDKVVAYVTREHNGELQLLVFEHEKKWSEAGLQVPAGTVEKGESLEQAVLREVFEETGLRLVDSVKKIDEYIYFREMQGVFNNRHVFHLITQEAVSYTHLTLPTICSV